MALVKGSSGIGSMRAAALGLIGAGAIYGGVAAMSAQATTGNADGLPEPKILVNTDIGDRYIGRFYLTEIERSARLESAVLDVDYTESVEHEFLVGDAYFYQYNRAGRLTSWTASMYPWVYRNGLMSLNLLVPGTLNDVLGKMVISTPTNLDTPEHPNQERIAVALTIGAQTYKAVFRQVEDDNPTPTQLPKAKQLPSTNTAPPAEPPSEAGEASEGTGVYASVVHYATTLSG
jgi:hypothetical protein